MAEEVLGQNLCKAEQPWSLVGALIKNNLLAEKNKMRNYVKIEHVCVCVHARAHNLNKCIF